MTLLKTKKKKTWHSVCGGQYEFKDKKLVYIVEMSEDEYIDYIQFKENRAKTIELSANDLLKVLKDLDNPPKAKEELKKLMKGN